MALTDAQKEYINGSVDHLLDFSSDPKKFQQELSVLEKVLSSTVSVQPNNVFYPLQKSLLYPTETLQGLERYNPLIKISEVQIYLIEHLLEILTDAAKVANVALDQANWNKEKFVTQFVTDKNKLDEFVSVKVRTDSGENPWQLPVVAGKIYTPTLRIEEKKEIFVIEEAPEETDIEEESLEIITRNAVLDITVRATNAKKTIFLKTLPHTFANDEEEDGFMETLRSEAAKKAEEFAVESVLNHLGKKFRIAYHDRVKIKNTKSACLIVTNPHYFNLLDRNKITCSVVANLSLPETENLIDPTIISLVNHGICDFNTAKKLTPAEKRVVTIPYFYSQLKDKKITLNQLLNVSDSRSRFLTYPVVVNLISQDKLTLAQARRLPTFLLDARHVIKVEDPPLDVLGSSLYLTFFRTHNIPWDKFEKITKDQCQLLLNKSIAKLIVNSNLEITAILQVSNATCELINKLPHLLDWLEAKLCKLNEINAEPKQFNELYVWSYVRRLYAIFLGSPYTISGVKDTAQVFIQELPDAAFDCNISEQALLQKILYELVFIIKKDIQEKLKNDSSINLVKFTQELDAIFPTENAQQTDWLTVLDKLIQWSIKTQRIISMQNSLNSNGKRALTDSKEILFQNKKSKFGIGPETEPETQNYFHHLLALQELVDFNPQPSTPTYQFF